MKRILAVILVLALCLSGCKMLPVDNQSTKGTEPTQQTEPSIAPTTAPTNSTEESNKEMFTDRDRNPAYDAASAVAITLSGSAAAATSDAVKITGSTVKLTEAATYIVSGTLDDGMLVVDAPKDAKVQIVFAGASITSKTYAPLFALQADKVFVTLAEGTENTLTGGESFTAIDDNNIDGVVYAKTDLTFNGTGSLTVTSPGGHGIVCKDDLVITGGNFAISSASHAIDANDSVRISGGNITADAGKDGIHAENSDDASLGFVYISGGNFKAEAEGDGISAGSYLQITGGDFDVTAGGGSENGGKQSSEGYGGFGGGFGGMGGGMGGKPQRPGGRAATTTTETAETTESTENTESTSMKGLKAGTDLKISGGSFKIDSADDGVHSNGSLYLENGTFTVATGDDGFHAEDTLDIAGGTVTITECYEGLEALHIKVSGGDITLTASDDGLNAAGGTDQSGLGGRDNGMFGGMPGGHGGMGGGMSSGNGSIVISGGKLNITASGDGVDANGTLEITGGYTTVCGPTQGDTATLDYDKTGTISGGTFIGTGASGMAQTFSDSEQGVIAVQVGSAAAGTQIKLTDGKGNVILTHTPALGYNVVILSSPDMKKGETYNLTVGTQSGEFEAS